MLDEKAPTVCEAIWKALPVKTSLHHAKIAGEEMIAQFPRVVTDKRENTVKVYQAKPGDVCWFPSRQIFLIYYGECCLEPADVDVFATIGDNLEELKVAGREAWRNPGRMIEITRKK